MNFNFKAFHRRLLFNMRYVPTKFEMLESEELCIKNIFMYCRDILTAMTTGILSQSVCNFFSNDSCLKDLKMALIFIDVNFRFFLMFNYKRLNFFSALIKGISIGLRPAVYLFKLHLNSLCDSFIKLIDENLSIEQDITDIKNNPLVFYI